MNQPRLTVILCTYNRAESLRQALESLSNLSLPDGWSDEILIIDNNSSDHTAKVGEIFVQRDRSRFRYIFESRQGKSYALNTGIAEAKADILVFTDDDVTFDPGWLEELLKPFEHINCLGAAGKISPVWTVEKPYWLQLEGPYKLMSAIVCFDLGSEPCILKTPPYGANMAFRKEAFQKYGNFRTDLGPNAASEIRGEDTEFCRRLINAGETLVYTPRSIVYHPVEKCRTEKSFFLSWYFDYGRASIKEDESQSSTRSSFGIPHYYLFLSLPRSFLKWVFTFSSRRRFYHKLTTYLVLGKIVESFRMWQKGLESLSIKSTRESER
jgi:glycosyltransferase involved in cell wall biosynthesis